MIKQIRLLAALTILALAFVARAQTNNTAGLTGTVVDADQHPVAGVEVVCYPPGEKAITNAQGKAELPVRATTDAAGNFRLAAVRRPDAAISLIARKPGFAIGWCAVRPADKSAPLIYLNKPTVLAGAVLDENAKPIAGAEVHVSAGLLGKSLDPYEMQSRLIGDQAARDCFSARTGPDGQFRLENFPETATAELIAEISGRTMRWNLNAMTVDGYRFHAGQREIRLVMEPVGCVEGRIAFDRAMPQPLPAAYLTLLPEDATSWRNVNGRKPDESAADGTFRLENLGPGRYFVKAAFGSNSVEAGWVADPVRVSVESGRTSRGVELKALTGGFLEVAVTGETNSLAMSKIEIETSKEGYQVSDRVGTNGLVLLRLPAGDYQMHALRNHSRIASGSAHVDNGVTNRAEIEVSQPKQLTGVVLGVDGKPVPDMPVRLVGRFGHVELEPKTDAQGRFSMDFDSGSRDYGNNVVPCLLVRDVAHNLAAAHEIDDGEDGSIELKLAPGLMLAGKVECDGKPVTNCAAAVIFWTGRSGMHLTGMNTARSPGQIEIPALPPGRKYGLVFSAPGYGQKSVLDIGAPADPGRVELDVAELRPANLRVAGQVLDGEDKPVAGARVYMYGDSQPSGNAETDDLGRFAFEQVCEGQVRVNASFQNSHGNASVEGGDTNIVIRLGESVGDSAAVGGHKLAGVITDPDGKPVAGALLKVFPVYNASGWIKSDAEGRYKLSWSLPPWRSQSGEALLVAREPGRGLAMAKELAEETTNQNLQLQKSTTVTGVVQTPEQTPLPGAQVGVWIKVGNSFDQWDESLAPTDGQGRFKISGLPAEGNFRLYAQANGRGKAQQNLDNSADTNSVEMSPFILKPADKVLGGRVVNQQDKPLSGVNVNMSGEGQPDGFMATDSQGRFHFKVCEGEVRLYANAENSFGQISALAGDTNVVIQLGNNSSASAAQPRRASLKDKPLPDLAPLGLPADCLQSGKPVLLCLFDLEQRPSRRAIRVLAEQSDALKQKGITVLAVQAIAAAPEALKSWQESSPVPFPVGRLEAKSDPARWVARAESLPWLILADSDHKVVAEGFALDDLDAQLKAVIK